MTRQQPALTQTIFASADLDPMQVLSGAAGAHAPSAHGSHHSHSSFHGSDSIPDYSSFGDFDTDTVAGGASSSPGSMASASSAAGGNNVSFLFTPPVAGAGDASMQSQELRERRMKAKNFLATILTSHFQTHQRTVVLGEDVALVNLVRALVLRVGEGASPRMMMN
jgi:hypothetical protein